MGVDYKSFPDCLLRRLRDSHNPKKARIRAKFFEKEFEFFSKHIRDQDVLVAGSGFGHDSLELAKYNKLVIGVELHPKLVKYSKKNAQRLGFSNINFKQGDITNLIFKENTFDSAVLNMGTIGNFDDKSEVIKELLRVAYVLYLDFYPPGKKKLEIREKMYQEEGWMGARIKGNSIVSNDGLESVCISKKEMNEIVEIAGGRVRYYPLCSFAIMAEVRR